jgi:hypothetical protein
MTDTARAFGPTEALRARLFVVSYAPLWLTFGLQALPKQLSLRWTGTVGIASIAWFALAAWGFIDGWRVVKGAGAKGETEQRFVEIADQGAVVAGYLATYLLPLIGVTASGLGDWLSYGVYFAVALIIFIRSDLALVNPTLYLYGWRVYSARVSLNPHADEQNLAAGASVLVVCRNAAMLDSVVRTVSLAGCHVVKSVVEDI